MEKFILFFRGGNTESEVEKWSLWVEGLKKKGAFVDGAPLIKNGKIISTNGENISDFVFDIADNARGFAILKAKDIE